MGASQALINNEELYKDFILPKTLMMGKQTTETGQAILHNILQTPVAKNTTWYSQPACCKHFLSACCLCVRSLQPHGIATLAL